MIVQSLTDMWTEDIADGAVCRLSDVVRNSHYRDARVDGLSWVEWATFVGVNPPEDALRAAKMGVPDDLASAFCAYDAMAEGIAFQKREVAVLLTAAVRKTGSARGFAKQLGVAHTTLNSWCSGAVVVPRTRRLDILNVICGAIDD